MNLSTASINIPSKFNVGKNFPNPFNASTEIVLSIDRVRHVELNIYDLIGNKIVNITNHVYSPGQYKVKWDGKNSHGNNLSSGVYIYTIISDEYIKSDRMILLK